MANPICNAMDRLKGKQARKCDSGCKNYGFDHLDTPCELSSVYSVKKGKDCYIYEIYIDNKEGK